MLKTKSDYTERAKTAAGNWQEFTSFCWFERPPDAELWTIVYTHNRDSGLLDQCNGDAIAKALEPFHRDPRFVTVRPEVHSHWACGSVYGFAIKVYGGRYKKTVTKAFRTYCDLMDKLEDYACLDESDYSNREYDAACEAIRVIGLRWVKTEPPRDWTEKVFRWLWDNDDKELENIDDQGAYPSEEAVRTALRALNLHEPEEDDGQDQK